jgi:hypothetical protein
MILPRFPSIFQTKCLSFVQNSAQSGQIFLRAKCAAYITTKKINIKFFIRKKTGLEWMQSLAGTWQNFFGTGKEGSKLSTLDYHSNMLFIFWVVNSRPPAAATLYNQILIMTNIMAGYLAMHSDHFLLTKKNFLFTLF